MSTSKELTAKYVRRAFFVRFEQIEVCCYVIDAKTAWGNDSVLVAPLSGRSEQWVSTSRLGEERAIEEAA